MFTEEKCISLGVVPGLAKDVKIIPMGGYSPISTYVSDPETLAIVKKMMVELRSKLEVIDWLIAFSELGIKMGVTAVEVKDDKRKA